MQGHTESEGRNRWGTARERERRKARREIRARVANGAGVLTHPKSTSIGTSLQQISLSETQLTKQEEEDLQVLRSILRHVEAGKASAFSLTTLSQHFLLLNKPIPVALLSSFKIKTLCTSRFGTEYARWIQEYAFARETCTLYEYAAWLGEYKLLGPMIAGGLDPTVRGKLKNDMTSSIVEEGDVSAEERRRRALSIQVLQRFFDAFPSSLSSYIVKRGIDFRFQYYKEKLRCNDGDDDNTCALCGSNEALLAFGSPCHDVFCESCYWQDILKNIDNRNDGDVVRCPVCGVSQTPSNCNTIAAVDIGDSPSERYRLSLEKFQALPADTRELKQLPKRSKPKTRSLSSSWSEAVAQSIGSSQDVRQDKFFNYAERGCYHFVRGCLVNGVDVNATNEYGQTCLHISAWRGYTRLVELLMHFGAVPFIRANGGVTVERSSQSNGHKEIVQLLRQRYPDSPLTDDATIRENIIKANDVSTSSQLDVLIDVGADHPGAGAYLIDSGFSSQCIDSMIELWQILPVASCEATKKVSKTLCSVRSYFCDSEGQLSRLLTDVISDAFETHSLSAKQVLVFPHMRFLHYAKPGSVLGPHVDLPRTDIAGNHSTHTFILYLFDCNEGGETLLLGAESGDGRDVTLARVSPRKGRLLLFPHACPHEGNEVVDVPKVLVRGEVLLTR